MRTRTFGHECPAQIYIRLQTPCLIRNLVRPGYKYICIFMRTMNTLIRLRELSLQLVHMSQGRCLTLRSIRVNNVDPYQAAHANTKISVRDVAKV